MNRLLLPVMLLAIGPVHAAGLPSGPLPEVNDHAIGYRSVAEALAALRQRNDVEMSTVRGGQLLPMPRTERCGRLRLKPTLGTLPS